MAQPSSVHPTELEVEILKVIWRAIMFGMVCLAMNTYAQAQTAEEILKRVTATYESLQTYKAAGSIASDMDTGGMKMNTETSFSMLLKKPNMYLISWTQRGHPMAGISQDGAVWSDGTQPYVYMGAINAYSKMQNDEVALATATGISGGAAFTIPSLFFPIFKEQPAPLSRLKAPKIEKTEKIGEEDCYVISGTSAISKQETFWISKTKHLVMKYARSMEPPEGGSVVPEMTDAQIDEAIKAMGQQPTDESRKSMKEMMKHAKETLKNTKISGWSTETNLKISSPELTKTDFQFAPPKTAVIKDSLFGGGLGHFHGESDRLSNSPGPQGGIPKGTPIPTPSPLAP